MLDRPGSISMLGFNQGDDVVRLSGNASRYQIAASGANVRLSDGDTTVDLVTSPAGTYLSFADGYRKLVLAGNEVHLGDQALTATPATVTAAAPSTGPADLADPSVVGRFLPPEGPLPAVVGGKIDVLGTTLEAERFEVAGGEISLRTGFNTGTDVVVLPHLSVDYTVVRSAATVLLASGDSQILIPTTPAGVLLHFPDGDQVLQLDPATGSVRVASQDITETAARLGPATQVVSIDVGSAGSPVSLDAGAGKTVFQDDVSKRTTVQLNAFGNDDFLSIKGAAAGDLQFSRIAANKDGVANDLAVTHAYTGGTDTIVLIDAVATSAMVTDAASAAAAIGREFIVFG